MLYEKVENKQENIRKYYLMEENGKNQISKEKKKIFSKENLAKRSKKQEKKSIM